MANDLEILKQGVEAWNKWREKNPEIQPDLSRANLTGANLSKANLSGANLNRANLSKANLSMAVLKEVNLTEADLSNAHLRKTNLSKSDLYRVNLIGANLREADLSEGNLKGAYLSKANLSKAKLTTANLSNAHFREVNLSGADLSNVNLVDTDLIGADLSNATLREADLTQAKLTGAYLREVHLDSANLGGANLSEVDLTDAHLVKVNFKNANLTGCRIYGISAWGLKLEGANQENLIITPPEEPVITVDNLEVAQFIYMLLHNEKIRTVIDTITSKVVLILGRFTPERKAVLNALRNELRKRNYLPVLFDFEKPASRDFTETIRILAGICRFIIADLTEPSSIPKELEAIVPSLAIPVQPLIEDATRPYSMFKDYWKYDWILKVHRYEGLQELIASLGEAVIAPAEVKVKELEKRRYEAII